MRSVVLFPNEAIEDIALIINVPGDLIDIESIDEYIRKRLHFMFDSHILKCFECPPTFPILHFIETLRNEVKDDA